MISKLLRFYRMLRFITEHPLNRKRKVASMLRLVSWQLGSRIASGPVTINFVNDAQLLVRPGMTGATGNIYTGLHEFEDMAFVLHVLRTSDLFVDVGANVGSYTILASAALGAKTIAFEPIPTTYGHLVDNIDLNGVHDLVTAHNIGVGAERGELIFTSSLDTVNHVLGAAESDIASTKIAVNTLDETLGESRPTVIKIDVEGFETRVIDGAGKALSRDTLLAVVMELNGSGERYGFDESTLHARMLGYAFRPFTYSPFTRQLLSLEGKKSTSGNTLYIKNLERVQERLVSAQPFTVLGHTI
jgi:FkbM family methyltransferase